MSWNSARMDIIGQNGNTGEHYGKDDSFLQTSNPQYSEFIALSRYARWDEDKGRRETWGEVCSRVTKFWTDRHPEFADEISECFTAQAQLLVMGSMRANMTAGPALERDNVAGYNCAYNTISGNGKEIKLTHDELDAPVVIHLKSPIDFDEGMYILMCGTGLGFSVERQYITNLPKVCKPLNRREYENTKENYPGVSPKDLSIFDFKNNIIIVADTKYGWASSLRILIFELYNGNFDVQWDTTAVREAGAKLKTFGGRSSGPEPLVDLFEFVKAMFKKAEGRKLTSIECHDLCCKIANIVVVGGVRRSALIGLSNPTDDRIRVAKQGNWSIDNPQRALANNSAAYTEKPDFAFFLKEWISLYESKSGERGMFSRVASQKKAAENGRRDASYEFGTNPCCEIILRPKGFCNLTEVVIREHDTLEDLKNKVRLATIIGTFQSTLVDFKYLCQEWVDNAKEERLLGVSFTGIMDHSVMSGSEGKGILEEWLNTLRIHAIQTNKTWAHKLGIPQSAAVTCVKPSGTVSQLVDSASGIHFRFAKHYIRRVRGDIKDPLTEFMMDNIPWEMDNMVPGMVVFEFPQKAPKHSITVGDRDALYQLEIWKVYYDNWCEHKPSITVYYKDNEEFMRVGAWLYENFDECSGVSFLPVAEHIYSQAPYEEISEVVYNAMKSMEPEFNWASLTDYEEIDNTKGVGELACTGSVCEIVDI